MVAVEVAVMEAVLVEVVVMKSLKLLVLSLISQVLFSNGKNRTKHTEG